MHCVATEASDIEGDTLADGHTTSQGATVVQLADEGEGVGAVVVDEPGGSAAACT